MLRVRSLLVKLCLYCVVWCGCEKNFGGWRMIAKSRRHPPSTTHTGRDSHFRNFAKQTLKRTSPCSLLRLRVEVNIYFHYQRFYKVCQLPVRMLIMERSLGSSLAEWLVAEFFQLPSNNLLKRPSAKNFPSLIPVTFILQFSTRVFTLHHTE